MSFNFSFRTVENKRDLDKLIEFLRLQNLNYPNYEDWIERAREEVHIGYKTAVVAEGGGFVLGDIIWQPHKTIRGIREIKNLRIHPKAKERYFARFLLKQAEMERSSEDNFKVLIADLREDHPDKTLMLRLLTSMGYREYSSVALYDQNALDIIMVKDLFKRVV